MNRIFRHYMEHIVTWHCNLKCTNCSSGSPFQPHRDDDLSIFVRDLNILGKYVNTPFIRLIGGEPLMHPQILDYLREIKKAGYKANLSTNGIMIPTMPDEFFELVDTLSVSIYSNNNINYGKIVDFLDKKDISWENVCDVKRTHELKSMQYFKDNYGWHEQGSFIVLDKYEKHTDERAREVYDPCLLKDMCHSFMNGKYYKCNICITKGPQYDNMGIPVEWNFEEEDGFDFTGDNEEEIMAGLRDFVEGEGHKEIMKACYYCEGYNTSRNEPHGQFTKQQVHDVINKKIPITNIT